MDLCDFISSEAVVNLFTFGGLLIILLILPAYHNMCRTLMDRIKERTHTNKCLSINYDKLQLKYRVFYSSTKSNLWFCATETVGL